jgi:hypothetical protein
MCNTLVTAVTHPQTDSDADRLVETLLPDIQHSSKPVSFNGYHFHILPGGGGFAAIAYPAVYRSSGVMTFIVQEDGVFEQELGPHTATIAGAMSSYHADATWSPVDSEP